MAATRARASRRSSRWTERNGERTRSSRTTRTSSSSGIRSATRSVHERTTRVHRRKTRRPERATRRARTRNSRRGRELRVGTASSRSVRDWRSRDAQLCSGLPSSGLTAYCFTQSTCIVEVCTRPRPRFGNQSSWMHRCIGPGGRISVRSVRHHSLPSRKVATWVGVHSTAQLCHCVASATTLPETCLVALPVVQEDVGLLPGVVHHLHEVDLPADREVLGVGPQQQQGVVRRVARGRASPGPPSGRSAARRPTPCPRCCPSGRR